MIKLLIIADDFTGALDTGVQFATCGAQTYVVVDAEIDYTKIASNIEVLVIDTETRHLNKTAAYQKVFSIVKQASKMEIPYIYKKTDSALRGNIGSELTAAIQASGEKHIHFVPAFPQMGRTTVNGVHYVNGIPISKSVFGQDPFEPVRHSDIREIIASQSDIQVNILKNKVLESCVSMKGILLYDSSCNQDIENIVAELIKKDEIHLMAGCAGLACVLSHKFKWKGKQRQIFEIKDRILVACGSVNPISVAQCNDAENKGAPRFKLTAGQKLNPDWIKSYAADAFIRQLYDACKKNHIVILDTNDSENGESAVAYAREKGISPVKMRVDIVSTMACVLKRLIDRGFDSTIFIMGGDSLVEFVRQAGIKAISPVCEIECGVVLSQFKYHHRILNVISKSGGFGQSTLFSDLYDTVLRLNEGKDA
jgi:uncharacterized protein YgbK (DUF1537 family)